MITEQDLQEAIAECQGTRNPNANTCIKLAAFLTIKREMFGESELPVPQYSYDTGESEKYINYDGDTDFASQIGGRKSSEIWPVIDELMTTLQAVQPRLYEAVMRKIRA